jgi:hypothetical protein
MSAMFFSISAMFELQRQFHAGASDFAQLLPNVRIVEGLGVGQGFFSAHPHAWFANQVKAEAARHPSDQHR